MSRLEKTTEQRRTLKAWADNGSISLVVCVCHLMAIWSQNRETLSENGKQMGTACGDHGRG